MPTWSDESLAQIRELLRYESVFTEFCGAITGTREWREARCPFHDDTNPSMGVNIRHGGFICHACGASGDFIDFYKRVRSINFVEAIAELARRVGIEPQGETEEEVHREIDRAIVTSAHERLMTTPDKLSYLTSERGLTEEIIREFKIGHDGQRFYIPIMEGGRIVNIRRYDPNARGQNKMISWRTGFGTARLWPMETMFNAEHGDVVYLCEGEMDCLLARSRGLNAVTCTGGAGTWRDPWNVLFAGLNVVICYDSDAAGRAGAAMIARKLHGRAASIRVVTIPLPEIQGADLTDYLVAHGHAVEDFLQLVRDTPEFEPSSETEDPQPEIHLGTMTAAQILSDPESLRPPQVVVENFGWLQRTTLISAREKSGKSTLLTALATAVSSNRPWLGTPVLEGEVLWVGLEEHPHDQARRLGEMGADLEHVHLVVPPFDLRDPVRWLDRLVCSIDPRLVGIDSLAALAVKFVKDSNSPDDWTGLFTELTCVVRESSAAWIFLAHSKKEGNEYRGSTAIGANVDAILQMKEEAQGVRRFTNNRARWIVRDFAIRLAENEYGLVGGEVSLEASTLTFIGTNPGASLTHIRRGVTGSNKRIRSEVHRLVSEGQIVNRGMGPRGTAYYLIADHDRYDAIRAVTDQVMTDAGRSYLSEVFDVAVETGRRINAICQVRYADLRLDDGTRFGSICWPADTDKMERETNAPLSQIARRAIDRVLRERPGIGDAYLFPNRNDASKPISRHRAARWLRRAEKLAEVEPLQGSLWHAYRRKWATERKHLPDTDVAEAGGWKTIDTMRLAYQHADPETMFTVVTEPRRLRAAR